MNKFYIIAVTYEIEGLFALATSVINHVIYAKNNGYIPIVDLKHYDNQYFKDDRVFKDNVWEYFFEQPNGYNLDNVTQNSNVLISQNCFFPDMKEVLWNGDVPKQLQNVSSGLECKKNTYKKYLKFNSQIQQYLDEKLFQICNSDEILGVLCRGTDYTKRRTYGEHIQPETKKVIEKVKQFIEKYPQINRIYVATEDNEIYETFKKEFKDLLIENSQYKYSYDNNSTKLLSQLSIDRKNHNYSLAKEYLFSIYLLSKCKYFIGGKTTGTKWAWILSENWKDFYIWDLGKYGKTIKERIFSLTTIIKNKKTYKILQIFGIKFFKKLK